MDIQPGDIIILPAKWLKIWSHTGVVVAVDSNVISVAECVLGGCRITKYRISGGDAECVIARHRNKSVSNEAARLAKETTKRGRIGYDVKRVLSVLFKYPIAPEMSDKQVCSQHTANMINRALTNLGYLPEFHDDSKTSPGDVMEAVNLSSDWQTVKLSGIEHEHNSIISAIIYVFIAVVVVVVFFILYKTL